MTQEALFALETILKEIKWRDEETIRWAKLTTFDSINHLITYNLGVLAFTGLLVTSKENLTTVFLLSIFCSITSIVLASIFQNIVVKENIKYLNDQKEIYIKVRDQILEEGHEISAQKNFKREIISKAEKFQEIEKNWNLVELTAGLLFIISLSLIVIGILCEINK